MADMEKIKAELGELAKAGGPGAVLPAALLAIIELAESGNASSGKILELLREVQQQQGDSSVQIKEALEALQKHFDAEAQKRFSANKADNQKIVELLEKQHNEQKAENAKKDKRVFVLLGVILAVVVLVLAAAAYIAFKHFAG